MNTDRYNGLNGEYGGVFVAAGRGGAVFKSTEGQAVKYVYDASYHDAHSIMMREAHYLQALEGASFRLPSFISHEIKSGRVNVVDKVEPYIGIITSEFVPDVHFLTIGDVLSYAPQDQLEIFVSAVKLLAKMQRAKPEPIAGQESVLREKLHRAYDMDKQRNLRQGFYSFLSAKLAEIEGATDSVFCHGDFSLNNLMYEDGKGFTGAIDFGMSGYSIPETDLCHYFMNDDLRRKVIAVYEQETGRAVDHDRLQFVDLLNSFQRMVSVAYNNEPYDGQQNDYEALQGRVKRIAEETFYTPFQPVSWGNVIKPSV